MNVVKMLPLALLLGTPYALHAQSSLTEAAKQTAAAREKAKDKPARVYTNKDLVAATPAQPLTVMLATATVVKDEGKTRMRQLQLQLVADTAAVVTDKHAIADLEQGARRAKVSPVSVK